MFASSRVSGAADREFKEFQGPFKQTDHTCMSALQLEKEYEAAALDVLHNKCAIQDVFADSRFLKQEALQALVAAIISAPGQLPSPPPAAAGQHGAASGPTGDSSYHKGHADRAAAGVAVDWEAAELCLDLLLVSGGETF